MEERSSRQQQQKRKKPSPLPSPPVRPIRVQQELEKAARASEEFMEDFCLEASPPKCWTFAIGSAMRKRMRKFHFAGGVLERPVQAERVLGAHLPFTGKQTQGAHGDRLEAAVERARRVKWLPLAFHQREQIVSAAIIPKGIHAALSSQIPKRQMNKLRAACTAATWGGGRRKRCQELHSALLVKGHRADPVMACTVQRI